MKKFKLYILLLSFSLIHYSCFDDLNTVPLDPEIVTASSVYEDPEAYKQVLAKLYAGLALSGQQGPAGQSDIEGIDEGFGQYLRGFWYHQELPTDEALIAWNDQTIRDFHDLDWTSTDGFIFAFYSRVFYQIPLCNEYLRETSDEKLDERNVDQALRNEIQTFRAEARFLRALSYWHALDHFRNVPFVTEDDKVGSFFPEQISGPELFDYIESELLDLQNDLLAPRTNEYGRADQAAAWTLLAKLYLNAEVYTGTAHYNECLEYCEKVINAGFSLEPEYEHLFLADNHNSEEIIFPIVFDGVNSRTWGGTTFIIRAGIGGTMDPSASGVLSGWGGTRATQQLVDKFGEIGGLVVESNRGNTSSYPKIYTPGSFQEFDYSDTDNALSSVNQDDIYEGHKYFPDQENLLRVTTIPSPSAPSFGDNNDDGILDQFGSDIVINGEGYYFIQVDLNTREYIIEKREWDIVSAGSSVSSNANFTYDETENALKATVTLGEGEYYFIANNDAETALGDNGADAILEYGGDPIVLDKSGEFEVLLYLNRPDYSYEIRLASFDVRGLFYTDGQSEEINDITLFTDGIAVNKFKNLSSTGEAGSDGDHADTDFPMFRLADVYLMASEAIVRSNGDLNLAADYFNEVRTRAFGGSTGGNINSTDLNLQLLIDERARELYWECHRRTDLVRFNQLTSSEYLWDWKGGVQGGTEVMPFRRMFPIPSSDIGANPNLSQNEGY